MRTALLLLAACTREPAKPGEPLDPPAPTPKPNPAPTPPGDPCDNDVPDPGSPTFPAVIDTLTVTVETGPGAFDGTDDASISLCLTETRCFPLTQATGDQLGFGAIGVWMFAAVGLPRAEVDRVELKVTDGTNQWRPVGLDLRFDGEPVYCAALDVAIGTESGDEVASWIDPLGLHNDCASAWGRPLTHGPLVGAVTDTTALLWARTDATRAVSARVWPADDPTQARIAAWSYPRPEDDFTAHLAVGCLTPSTAYTYEILVDGDPAPPGTFTTAPAPGSADTWQLAFGSCAKEPSQPIFASILGSDPDLFAFVGDNHYGNTADLDALRWYYRWSLERFERAALVRSVSTLATWDDHDFVGNDTWGDAPGKEQALRAFQEYWANPSAGLPEAEGVFFAHPRGDVDLIFLDDRYWRGVEGSILGDVQHDWLVAQLTQSTATFKLVIDGSQWSFEGGSDSWDDFPDERDALFQSIADAAIPGVLLLSGDIHRSELRLLDAPGYAIPEITSSPLSQLTYTACGPTGGELLACAALGNYWISLDIDTIASDPAVTATIRDTAGLAVDAITWTRAQLE